MEEDKAPIVGNLKNVRLAIEPDKCGNARFVIILNIGNDELRNNWDGSLPDHDGKFCDRMNQAIALLKQDVKITKWSFYDKKRWFQDIVEMPDL